MMEPARVTVPNAVMLGEVDRLLSEGHTVVILTKGVSMMPFIRGGVDSVELYRCDELKVGQIALGQISPGHYVLHRIVAMDGERVTLHGDGNLGPFTLSWRGQDRVEICSRSSICGVVSRIIRPGKPDVDCSTSRFYRRSRRWRLAPYVVRRLFNAIYRRLI